MACRLQGGSAEVAGRECGSGEGEGEYMNMSLGYTLNCSIRCSARQHDKYAKAQVAWLRDSFVSYTSPLFLSSLLLLHARLQLGNFSACRPLAPSHSRLPQLMRHIPFALRFRCKLAWNVFWISFKACHTIAYPLSLFPSSCCSLHTLLALSASVAAAAAALPPAAFFSISTTLKIDRHGSRFDFDKFPWPQLVERFTPRSMWGSQSPSIVYGSARSLFPPPTPLVTPSLMQKSMWLMLK